MPIYGRALNPRVYGRDPSIQPNDYEYLDWKQVSVDTAYTDSWQAPEDNWYRVWVIARGGKGGNSANAGEYNGVGGAGGGGHGGMCYFIVFLEAGDSVSIERYVSGNTPYLKASTTINGVAYIGTVSDGMKGNNSSGNRGGTGGAAGTVTGSNITRFTAGKGINGIDASGETGGIGGSGGYMTPDTKYSFGTAGAYSYNPPQLNLGNGGNGGGGPDAGGYGDSGGRKRDGGVIFEVGVYNS